MSIEMFEPKLKFKCGEDDELIVHAETPTPNTCYSAGRARLISTPTELPFSLPPLPGPVYFLQLGLEFDDEKVCSKKVNMVEHRVEVDWDEVGDRVPVLALVTLGRRIVGRTRDMLKPPEECPREESPVIDTDNWAAWSDVQPPNPEPNLQVKGEVVLPTPAWEAELTDPERRGDELHLQVDTDSRDGVVIQVVTTRTVEWATQDRQFAGVDNVVVHVDEDNVVRMDVEEVH